MLATQVKIVITKTSVDSLKEKSKKANENVESVTNSYNCSFPSNPENVPIHRIHVSH